MAKFDYTKALKDYGTVVTFTNHFFTDKKTGNLKVGLIVGGNEAQWYTVEAGTLLKPFLNTTTMVILDGRTIVYPNSETHPVEAKIELPAELKAITARINAHRVEKPVQPVTELKELIKA